MFNIVVSIAIVLVLMYVVPINLLNLIATIGCFIMGIVVWVIEGEMNRMVLGSFGLSFLFFIILLFNFIDFYKRYKKNKKDEE